MNNLDIISNSLKLKTENNNNKNKNMFNPGIEPGTVCVLGRRDNHYTN
jgi:hypothetical protein